MTEGGRGREREGEREVERERVGETVPKNIRIQDENKHKSYKSDT